MKPRILIAGVGNLFHGDDGFGSEVARRLLALSWPPQVRVVDFGIRGHDLAFALQNDYAVLILIDVAKRGGKAGTLSVIEPDTEAFAPVPEDESLASHGMHPLRVLRLVRAAGGLLPRILLVACEPQSFGPDEGWMGLTPPVAAAVPRAVDLVQTLLERLVADER
jgi:hydrogenase maturation protease